MFERIDRMWRLKSSIWGPFIDGIVDYSTAELQMTFDGIW
jgi:hypothetical protein